MAAIRRPVARAPSGRPPTAATVVAWFALGTVLAAGVVLVGGYLALRSVAVDEAKRDTRAKVVETGQLVESILPDGLLDADPEAIRVVDDLVLARVLSSSVARVKIWSSDGRVLYSDEPSQIGGQYELDADQLALLREGGAEVEVSDLDRPENELDRGQGELIEAYTRIRTRSGTPVLFEVYERLESVNASAGRLLGALAPPILGGMALILLLQAPLVWSLARRLERGHEEREALLANAIAASHRERRRLAAFLHDGAVQDIAGVAFSLAPLAEDARSGRDTGEAAAIRDAVDRLRQTVRDLRVLLVDLHPPHLAAAGIAAAVMDLVSPLEARGVEVSVAVDDADPLSAEHEALVYRVVQEAVRNIVAHADARSVSVELAADGDRTRLVVADDGLGFAEDVRARRAAEGHVGLSLLEELARQSGGTLRVTSTEGEGTIVELEVPRR